jgi:hypothetical protein
MWCVADPVPARLTQPAPELTKGDLLRERRLARHEPPTTMASDRRGSLPPRIRPSRGMPVSCRRAHDAWARRAYTLHREQAANGLHQVVDVEGLEPSRVSE